MSSCPPSKNSNDERQPIFFLDRGGDGREFIDSAFESALFAGAVDVAVDQDGCHMERGVMAAEACLDAPPTDVAVVGRAVDQDGCHMERGVPVSCFGRKVDMIIASCSLTILLSGRQEHEGR